MANNYAPSTVTPSIPKNLVTDFELEILSAMGYTYASDVDAWYFYSEEGIYDLDNDDFEVDETLLVDSDEVYFNDGVFNTTIEAPVIFQNILKRGDLDEIYIKGAYYCDKMRPDEFGGFVTYITVDQVQSGSTDSLLTLFRANAKK